MNIIKLLVPKKDHKIVLRHQLSWYFGPLLLIIWFIFPEYRYIFATSMFCIVFIGIIETIFYTPVTVISKIYSIILHLILLLPIFYNKFFKNINKNPLKSCLQKYNLERKPKKVKFSNDNKNFYKNDIRYLVKLNIWNFIILILGILLLYYLPYWPYFMSKEFMIILFIIITFFLWIYAEYL